MKMCREEEKEESISATVEAVSSLRNSYETSDTIAKAAADNDQLKQRLRQMAKAFAKGLKNKTLWCGDAFSKLRAMPNSVEELLSHVRGDTQMYWAAKRTTQCRLLAQYADTLLQ